MSHPHVVKKKISVDINAKLSVVRTVQEIKKDLSQVIKLILRNYVTI